MGGQPWPLETTVSLSATRPARRSSSLAPWERMAPRMVQGYRAHGVRWRHDRASAAHRRGLITHHDGS